MIIKLLQRDYSKKFPFIKSTEHMVHIFAAIIEAAWKWNNMRSLHKLLHWNFQKNPSSLNSGATKWNSGKIDRKKLVLVQCGQKIPSSSFQTLFWAQYFHLLSELWFDNTPVFSGKSRSAHRKCSLLVLLKQLWWISALRTFKCLFVSERFCQRSWLVVIKEMYLNNGKLMDIVIHLNYSFSPKVCWAFNNCLAIATVNAIWI